MTNSIPGKTMLITGASSGIGKATAIACAQAGMNVVLTARRRKQLEALQEEIGGTTKIIVGDVTEDGFNEKMLRATGTFDAVFINAGHGIDQHTLDMNMKDVRSLFELNVFAAIVKGAAKTQDNLVLDAETLSSVPPEALAQMGLPEACALFL